MLPVNLFTERLVWQLRKRSKFWWYNQPFCFLLFVCLLLLRGLIPLFAVNSVCARQTSLLGGSLGCLLGCRLLSCRLLGSRLLLSLGLLGGRLLGCSLLLSLLLSRLLLGLLGGRLLGSGLLCRGLLGGSCTLLGRGLLLGGNRALQEVSKTADKLGGAAVGGDVEETTDVADNSIGASLDTLLKLCTVKLGVVLHTRELTEVRLDADALGSHAEGEVVEGHEDGIVHLALGKLVGDIGDRTKGGTLALSDDKLAGDGLRNCNAEARRSLPLALGVGLLEDALVLHLLNLLADLFLSRLLCRHCYYCC